MKARAFGLSAGFLVLLLPVLSNGQDKYYAKVTDEQVENILKDLNISYKKAANKKDNHSYYDFEREKYQIRLHNYPGKHLWIDCLFNEKAMLETANRWNVRAKFSRAVFMKEDNKDIISLESQLDCVGGATDGMIRQYVQRFGQECRDYSKFISE